MLCYKFSEENFYGPGIRYFYELLLRRTLLHWEVMQLSTASEG